MTELALTVFWWWLFSLLLLRCYFQYTPASVFIGIWPCLGPPTHLGSYNLIICAFSLELLLGLLCMPQQGAGSELKQPSPELAISTNNHLEGCGVLVVNKTEESLLS